MMLPEFMRFYKYTASQTLDEFAVTFFALLNSMHRLQAREAIQTIAYNSAAFSGGKEASSIMDNLKKQEKGLHGIVQEVRSIKK